jgi:hypothetical protein
LRNLPFFIRSGLPKDPKESQKVTLEIAFQGQPAGCYGKIPVTIIAVDEIMVTVLTRNSEGVQIAPEVCLDVWVLPYQTMTIFR